MTKIMVLICYSFLIIRNLEPTIAEEIINENPSCLKTLVLIETNKNITERSKRNFNFGKKKRKIKKKKVFKICEINGKKEIEELEVNDVRVSFKRRRMK
jgi:hypothetical protein